MKGILHIIAASLLVLLAAVACGTETPEPTATPLPLTVEVYANAVCDPEDISDEELATWSWGQYRDRLEGNITIFERADPPPEVLAYHLTALAFWKALLEDVKDKEPDARFNQYELAANTDLWTPLAIYEAAVEELTDETRQVLKATGCNIDDEVESPEPTPLTSYALEQPVTIDAGLLNKLSGEPELSGEIIITVKSIERAPNIEHNLYGKVEAEGVFVSIYYSLVNEANSRIQPSTQINDNFVLTDDRSRQWGTAGYLSHGADVADAFADQMGESDPNKWVAPGFTGTTAIAFDVPDSASGLRLISTRLGIEVSLEPPQ